MSILKTICGCQLDVARHAWVSGYVPCDKCKFTYISMKDKPCADCLEDEINCIKCATKSEKPNGCKWQPV